MKLEPCPQCMSLNLLAYNFGESDENPYYQVVCELCGTVGPSMREMKDAMDHWNLGKFRGYEPGTGWIISEHRIFGGIALWG